MTEQDPKPKNYPELIGLKVMVLKRGEEHQGDLGHETLVIGTDQTNEGRIEDIYVA
jgi:hypothetical protein